MNNMFDFFYNDVNKQIHKGFFPVVRLEPAKNPNSIDIPCIQLVGFKIPKDDKAYSDSFSVAFARWLLQSQWWEQVVLPDNVDVPHRYSSLVNCIINANSIPDDLWDNRELFEATMDLCPVVTQLDCVLWEGVTSCFLVVDSIRHDSKLLNAWIRSNNQTIENPFDDEQSFSEAINETTVFLSSLLRMVQEKELASGKTIKEDAFSSSILEKLLNPWEECDQSDFINLSEKETEDLSKLISERKRLFILSAETKKKAEVFAERTAPAWQVFVELINDISSQERDVLTQIKQDISSFQKLEIIRKYDAFVSEICAEKFPYNGKSYSLSKVFSQIEQRFTQAHNYCYVSSENVPAFKLTAAMRILVKDPTVSFNYIFITYHKLRLEPTQENARAFFSLVNRCIKVNLGVGLDDRSYASVDEMAEDFCSTVQTFYTQSETDFESLLSEEIQADVIDIVGHSAFEYCIENQEEMWMNELISMQREYNSKPLEEIDPHLLAEEMTRIFADNEENEKHNAKLALIRQLVTSMSIIYMVYATMKRLINRVPDIFENVDAVKRMYRELCELDDALIHKVYKSTYVVNEYRGNKGMDASDLAEKESEANARLCEAILSDIEVISQSFDSQDIQQLFSSKTDIIESVWRFPLRDLPDSIIEKLDSISGRLCYAFVNSCKAHSVCFPEVKTELIRTLGERIHILPISVIDTLSTAELLYKDYAKEEVAEQGFDYSSISALYYQSFEEAFNEVVWKPYAEWINNSKEDGFSPDELSDLSKFIPGDLWYYTYSKHSKKSKNMIYIVRTHIDFGSIWHLIDSIKETCPASDFCSYVARLSSHRDNAEMFQDTSFIEECNQFAKKAHEATPKRNRSSHGGNKIDLKQCTDDKKAVLYDLESIRNKSIGLIQQLLNMVRNVSSYPA